ncbi:MAG: ABC transporter substrate binding protein [Candidatus Rokuibacteriota bacterium]
MKERTEALMVGDQAEFLGHEQFIVQLAVEARLPAIYAYRTFAAAGGLMAYALDAADMFRRLAGYIARILQGANPGELPFQQPTKFERQGARSHDPAAAIDARGSGDRVETHRGPVPHVALQNLRELERDQRGNRAG